MSIHNIYNTNMTKFSTTKTASNIFTMLTRSITHYKNKNGPSVLLLSSSEHRLHHLRIMKRLVLKRRIYCTATTTTTSHRPPFRIISTRGRQIRRDRDRLATQQILQNLSSLEFLSVDCATATAATGACSGGYSGKSSG